MLFNLAIEIVDYFSCVSKQIVIKISSLQKYCKIDVILAKKGEGGNPRSRGLVKELLWSYLDKTMGQCPHQHVEEKYFIVSYIEYRLPLQPYRC